MAINWLILRTKRSLSLLLVLGDFKHRERKKKRRRRLLFLRFGSTHRTRLLLL